MGRVFYSSRNAGSLRTTALLTVVVLYNAYCGWLCVAGPEDRQIDHGDSGADANVYVNYLGPARPKME